MHQHCHSLKRIHYKSYSSRWSWMTRDNIESFHIKWKWIPVNHPQEKRSHPHSHTWKQLKWKVEKRQERTFLIPWTQKEKFTMLHNPCLPLYLPLFFKSKDLKYRVKTGTKLIFILSLVISHTTIPRFYAFFKKATRAKHGLTRWKEYISTFSNLHDIYATSFGMNNRQKII